MKKLLFAVAFVASTTAGACTSDLQAACEEFVEVRNGCEAVNNDPPPKYGYNLCDNIDAECQAFYECAVLRPCEEVGDKFRLNYRFVENNPETEEDNEGCEMPENKECTDADLRP